MSKDQLKQRQARRDQTLSALERLPLNPGPVAGIMQCPGSDPDQLIKVLERCPVLAGRVIGVANSAGSSALHRMESIDRCVVHLGAKQARTVALTMALQLMVLDVQLDEQVLRKLWVAATTKAVAAQLIAQSVSPQTADAAYSLGLLQDIALPVLLAIDPAFFEHNLASADGKKPWTDLEREHFGIDHAELGALLLQKWNAPPAMIKQVANHHVPLEEDDMAWLAEMPARFAGLLKHADEQPTRTQQQTLAATHIRFLGDDYPTLDAVMKEITRRVKAMGKAAGGPARFDAGLIEQVALAVASDTFALAAQIALLDRQLSQNVAALAKSQEEALTDQLTRLLNRRGFESIGTQLLAQAHKAGKSAACFVIDLDNFKRINDTYGHSAGDTLLQAAGDLIRANVRPDDLVARIGGDEFALLCVGNAQADTHALAQRLHASCNGRRIEINAQSKAELSMSIGGVFMDKITQSDTPYSLIESADQIMYRTKRQGKAGISLEAKTKAA